MYVIDSIRAANIAGFGALALVLAVRARRAEPACASYWLAGSFASIFVLAVTSAAGAASTGPLAADGTLRRAGGMLAIAGLAWYPWLLLRFVHSVRPLPRGAVRASVAVPLLITAAALPVMHWPAPGDVRSDAVTALLAAGAAEWLTCSLVVLAVLVLHAQGQPAIVRRRIVAMVVAMAGMDVAIVLSATSGSIGREIQARAAGMLAAVAFAAAWRLPAGMTSVLTPRRSRALAGSVNRLLEARSEREVVRITLIAIGEVIGARSVRIAGSDHAPGGGAPNQLRFHTELGEMVAFGDGFAPSWGPRQARDVRLLAKAATSAIAQCRRLERERELTRERSELERARAAFVSSASHELRTPLTSIVGLAHTLRAHGGQLDGTVLEQIYAMLDGEARRLLDLVSNMLDLNELLRGGRVVARLPVDLSRVAHLVVDEIGQGRVSIDAADVVVVSGEAAALERAVRCLVDNLVRHVEGDAHRCVRVFEQGGEAVLVVEDGGAGVPVEAQEQMFEPFRYAVDQRLAAAQPGIGAGLAVARYLLRLHGGDLSYAPAFGGGSTFRATLPLRSPSRRVAGGRKI